MLRIGTLPSSTRPIPARGTVSRYHRQAASHLTISVSDGQRFRDRFDYHSLPHRSQPREAQHPPRAGFAATASCRCC
jgi:hypothetical protein